MRYYLNEIIDDRPVITAEIRDKWYNLWIVSDKSQSTKLNLEDLEEGWQGTAYLNHVPNPMAVIDYAARNNLRVSALFIAEASRRWYNDYYGGGVNFVDKLS